MPRLPPVTSAILPRTLNSCSIFIVLLRGLSESGQSPPLALRGLERIWPRAGVRPRSMAVLLVLRVSLPKEGSLRCLRRLIDRNMQTSVPCRSAANKPRLEDNSVSQQPPDRRATSAAPALGATPKDLLHKRGTLNLYH